MSSARPGHADGMAGLPAGGSYLSKHLKSFAKLPVHINMFTAGSGLHDIMLYIITLPNKIWIIMTMS